MKLYFSPLACSLATRIALYEAGAEATYVHVDSKSKKTDDGSDFHDVHALGLVPTIQTDTGDVVTENAAVLQYVADRYPDANLAPREALARTRLQQWLCFIGTELHKSLYTPLLDPHAGPDAKSYALAKAASRLAFISQHLENREFLLDHFTVADAYLFTALNWSAVTPVDLEPWPTIRAYRSRLARRPSIARAFAEERELYAATHAR